MLVRKRTLLAISRDRRLSALFGRRLGVPNFLEVDKAPQPWPRPGRAGSARRGCVPQYRAPLAGLRIEAFLSRHLRQPRLAVRAVLDNAVTGGIRPLIGAA